MPLLREQNLPLRVEGVTVAEETGAHAWAVMVTAAYPTPAMARKTPMNRRVVAIAVHAGVVAVETSTLRQALSVIEK